LKKVRNSHFMIGSRLGGLTPRLSKGGRGDFYKGDATATVAKFPSIPL